MRFIKPALLLLVVATTPSCAHQVTPLASSPTSSPRFQSMAREDDQARAEQLIKAKLQESGIIFLGIQLEAQEQAGLYGYTCHFSAPRQGLLCYYSAKGTVDLASGKTTTRRNVEVCLNPRGEAEVPR